VTGCGEHFLLRFLQGPPLGLGISAPFLLKLLAPAIILSP
jgi:hypothetical protein